MVWVWLSFLWLLTLLMHQYNRCTMLQFSFNHHYHRGFYGFRRRVCLMLLRIREVTYDIQIGLQPSTCACKSIPFLLPDKHFFFILDTCIGSTNPKEDHSLNPLVKRPTALTFTLLKVFESPLSFHSIWLLESHNLLLNHQSGFRKTRSTSVILLDLVVLSQGLRRDILYPLMFRKL